LTLGRELGLKLILGTALGFQLGLELRQKVTLDSGLKAIMARKNEENW
jgi:hypothetical protein